MCARDNKKETSTGKKVHIRELPLRKCKETRVKKTESVDKLLVCSSY